LALMLAFAIGYHLLFLTPSKQEASSRESPK